MHAFLSLAGLLGAVTVGAISPGPSFVFVVRTSVAASRREALAAALGLGAGAAAFSILVMLGLQALLVRLTWLFLALKLVGAGYLIYLGLGIWRGAATPLTTAGTTETPPRSAGRQFSRGFLTQVSNPKAMVVYGSLFAALLPRDLPFAVAATLPALIFVIEAGWYVIVAVALSSTAPREAYLRSKTVVDRVAGGVLGLLGARLLWTSATGR